MYFILLSYRIAHSNLYKLIKKVEWTGIEPAVNKMTSLLQHQAHPKKYKNSLPIIESFVKHQQHI
jgi:hypothetical protein